MEKKFEQRVCLKFCVYNGITATELLKMLQKCFGETSLSRTQVENLPHVSRPSTSVNDDSIEKVKQIVLENRRVGIREVSEQRCQTHGVKLWNQHLKIMVHYGTRLQNACVARNSN